MPKECGWHAVAKIKKNCKERICLHVVADGACWMDFGWWNWNNGDLLDLDACRTILAAVYFLTPPL